MGIVFFCQSCGARFEVPPANAGKKGRCRHCGQVMQVPRAQELASMMSMPALAPGAAASAKGGGAAVATAPPPKIRPAAAGKSDASMANWLRSAATSVGLAPLSMDNMRAVSREKAKKDLEDWGDEKPYAMVSMADRPAVAQAGGAAAGFVVRTWRKELGSVQKILRMIEQFAYLLSLPFIIAVLWGIASKSRGLALFGATFVVVLSLARIAATAATLVIVPLRDGINTRKMKKPLRRILEPAAMIAAVVAAFLFIPWLASDRSASGTITQRLEAEVQGLQDEMKGEIRRTADDARNLDVQKLGDQAKEKLRTIGNTDPGATATPPPSTRDQPQDRINNIIQDVGKRARDTIDEAQKP